MVNVLCPKCGTETDAKKTQCDFCGKIIIAETLARRQQIEQEETMNSLFRTGKSSRELGRSLDKLDDDDLFGDLEPFDLEDGAPKDDEAEMLEKSTKQSASTPQLDNQFDDDNETKKFKNPMENSKLMKKLKEDQDLFGSLD